MASNISTSLNLLKLQNAFIKPMKSKSGQMIDCVVIPIERNKLYIGKDNQAVYLNLIHFPLKNSPNEFGHTHTVKQSFTTKELEAMSQEEKDSKPFLGSSKDFGQSSGKPAETKTQTTSAAFDSSTDDDDDLPF